MTSVVWIYDTYANNFDINHKVFQGKFLISFL